MTIILLFSVNYCLSKNLNSIFHENLVKTWLIRTGSWVKMSSLLIQTLEGKLSEKIRGIAIWKNLYHPTFGLFTCKHKYVKTIFSFVKIDSKWFQPNLDYVSHVDMLPIIHWKSK